MRVQTHVNGDLRRLDIECQEDEPVIWIRDGYATVSLELTDAQLIELEAAVRAAKAQAKGATP